MKKSTIIAILVIMACIVMGFVFPSCKTRIEQTPYWYSGDGPIKARKEINDSIWKAFLECSKDEGDAGCDSCYQAIIERPGQRKGK